MRNLLNFLTRYNNLIIFLILEGLAIYLLTTGNNYHNAKIINGVRSLTIGVETKISNTRNYLNLREINRFLSEENASLLNKTRVAANRDNSLFFTVSDSLYAQQYYRTAAEVVNNSVNKQKNFFTINKGKRQGLTVDMAVTSGSSVAGLIVSCSEQFSVAMSLINLDFRLSGRIKSNGYFGSVSWDGADINHAILSEIPQHVNLNVGDTIETTGFSAIFPEGIEIGTISDFKKIGGDFYNITIELKTDFKKLHYVNVIGNMKKTEQLELENQFQ